MPIIFLVGQGDKGVAALDLGQGVDEAFDYALFSGIGRSGEGSPRSRRSTGRWRRRKTSSCRRCRKLVRLPLCAMAIPPASRSGEHRLAVADEAAAGGGIAGMADGGRPRQAGVEVLAGEGVGYVTQCGARCGSRCHRRPRCRRPPDRDAAGREGRAPRPTRRPEPRKSRTPRIRAEAVGRRGRAPSAHLQHSSHGVSGWADGGEGGLGDPDPPGREGAKRSGCGCDQRIGTRAGDPRGHAVDRRHRIEQQGPTPRPPPRPAPRQPQRRRAGSGPDRTVLLTPRVSTPPTRRNPM